MSNLWRPHIRDWYLGCTGMITSPTQKSYNAHTGQDSLSCYLSLRRTVLFGHVAQLYESTWARIAPLRCHIDISFNRLPDHSWHCRPGPPHIKWSDQIMGHLIQHTRRSVQECCLSLSPWWSGATALASYVTLTMMMAMMMICLHGYRVLQYKTIFRKMHYTCNYSIFSQHLQRRFRPCGNFCYNIWFDLQITCMWIVRYIFLSEQVIKLGFWCKGNRRCISPCICVYYRTQY